MFFVEPIPNSRITTDELLRGERNNPDREVVSEDVASKQKAKSDKQFKLMLHSNLSKIKNNKVTAIRFSTLAAICEVLNCEVGDILEYQKDE